MRKTSLLAAALMGAMLTPSTARAVIIIGGIGSGGASFTGTFNYVPTDSDHGTVTVSLTNTTPVSLGGFITGFLFNIPTDADVMSVIHTPPNSNFELLGESSSFQDGENGAPDGTFDIGSALGGNYEGGGIASDGIGVGLSGIWMFALTGTGLGTLTPEAFLSTLSIPTGSNDPEDFVVRFRGMTEDGSDKVPNQNPAENAIPEPGSVMLLGLGLASLLARRLARARK